MNREELRARLLAACGPAELAGPSGAGGSAVGSGTRIPAAVLIGLVGHPEGPSIILTERTAHLKNHAAEISLPGGRIEASDDGPAGAALREAFEEIGIAPERVELLGCLPAYETVTGFCVFPLVGWIDPPVEFALDAREVADVFQVPLSAVLDLGNYRRAEMVVNDEARTYYVLPYPGRHIWGATAAILVSLARALA